MNRLPWDFPTIDWIDWLKLYFLKLKTVCISLGSSNFLRLLWGCPYDWTKWVYKFESNTCSIFSCWKFCRLTGFLLRGVQKHKYLWRMNHCHRCLQWPALGFWIQVNYSLGWSSNSLLVSLTIWGLHGVEWQCFEVIFLQ